jgi:hypothetical protein
VFEAAVQGRVARHLLHTRARDAHARSDRRCVRQRNTRDLTAHLADGIGLATSQDPHQLVAPVTACGIVGNTV